MKCAKNILLLVAVICVTCSAVAQVKDETLGSIKRRFLNKRIVIIDTVATDRLLSWQIVTWPTLEPVKPEHILDGYLPASYVGKPGTVVSIVMNTNPVFATKPVKNAMGERLSEDAITDPYVDFYVHFEDDVAAQFSTSASTAYQTIKALPDTKQVQEEIGSNIASIIGKSLYAVHDSYLYSADTDIKDMVSSVHVKMLDSDHFPFLTPLPIEAAKYLDNYDALLLKIRLPNGDDVMAVISGESIQQSKAETFLGKISGTLLSAIPAALTQQEVTAIRKKEIFKGMRRRALAYVMGIPNRTHTSSVDGVAQLVFDGMYIYVNRAGVVTDWQSAAR